ncbi:hypothetical protein [Kitasatospora herbaricolor]|uniref:Uncharacterized protein n=1 Tax=Kitasatospora herbaricolor TaxID=68217 RepID=A0ABZ1WKU6_9ACTN|nr:hypothetical protein [Kitasatospora herbaricolor]
MAGAFTGHVLRDEVDLVRLGGVVLLGDGHVEEAGRDEPRGRAGPSVGGAVTSASSRQPS